MCEILAAEGYWVHFIVPDARGAQPFDIIAVKDGRALAIDCKTCAANSFSIRRLEYNQIFAFELWLKKGNEVPLVMVEHSGRIYRIPYSVLREETNVRLAEGLEWRGGFL